MKNYKKEGVTEFILIVIKDSRCPFNCTGDSQQSKMITDATKKAKSDLKTVPQNG